MKWGKINATLPKGTEPENVTMEMAVQWIAEKAPVKKKARKASAKKAGKKTRTKARTAKA